MEASGEKENQDENGQKKTPEKEIVKEEQKINTQEEIKNYIHKLNYAKTELKLKDKNLEIVDTFIKMLLELKEQLNRYNILKNKRLKEDSKQKIISVINAIKMYIKRVNKINKINKDILDGLEKVLNVLNNEYKNKKEIENLDSDKKKTSLELLEKEIATRRSKRISTRESEQIPPMIDVTRGIINSMKNLGIIRQRQSRHGFVRFTHNLLPTNEIEITDIRPDGTIFFRNNQRLLNLGVTGIHAHLYKTNDTDLIYNENGGGGFRIEFGGGWRINYVYRPGREYFEIENPNKQVVNRVNNPRNLPRRFSDVTDRLRLIINNLNRRYPRSLPPRLVNLSNNSLYDLIEFAFYLYQRLDSNRGRYGGKSKTKRRKMIKKRNKKSNRRKTKQYKKSKKIKRKTRRTRRTKITRRR